MQFRNDLSRSIVEADIRVSVANSSNRFARYGLSINLGGRIDFTRDEDEISRDQRFHGNSPRLVLRQYGVQDSVADVICDLVWVTCGNRFGCEQLTHENLVLVVHSANTHPSPVPLKAAVLPVMVSVKAIARSLSYITDVTRCSNLKLGQPPLT